MPQQPPAATARAAHSEDAAVQRPLKVLCILQDADRPTVATIAGLHGRGCGMAAICPPGSHAAEVLREAGVHMPDVAIVKRLDIAGIRGLRKELVRGGYDILHAFGNRGLQNGILASRGLPTRLVAYRGRVGNVSFFDPFSWMRHLNPRLDRLICVSDAVRDFYLGMRPAFLRGPAERFVRIYKGHDLAWYDEPPANLRDFGIPEGAFVVSCVANYRPHKGIDYLVGAMADLPRDWPVHLLLVGNMSDPNLDRTIAALPAPERIHRIGYRSDAPLFAAASDVFVLPSTIPEGLPRSVIEAMAYRRACIVTNFGGGAELVVDGISGLQVPPGDARAIADAIARLYEDDALRARIGEAARQRIGTSFNIEQTIEETLAVYRGLAASRSSMMS
jgi:glycosyltransferase involved in cell wall biosynthesis